MKVENMPAYVIHSRPFKDSSALLECLTPHHGLVTLVAKGAKRPRSRMQGLLQPFILLQIDWVGKGELKTLTQVDAQGMTPKLAGQKILLGLYLNEILMRLLQRLDPHPQLFEEYHHTLTVLSGAKSQTEQALALRQFELKIMAELGYGIDLSAEARTGAPIAPDLLYGYDSQVGMVEMMHMNSSSEQVVVSGASLIALREGQCGSDNELREAKKLMRHVLSLHLGNKPIESRKLFVQIKSPEGEIS